MSLPTFEKDVTAAYSSMASLESQNDYFVAGFKQGTTVMELIGSGKGGLRKVKEILKERFESDIAIAIFRVTAVDQRGNVKSSRTKLIHVVYSGPKTAVMKRAKVASWNSAFKQPFTGFNLSLQTDDVEGDLNESSIERSLRASGGAHQPTSFDFENVTEMNMPVLTSPTAHAPRSPGGSAQFNSVWNEHNSAFHAQDSKRIARLYNEEQCKLIISDTTTGGISIYNGRSEISHGFDNFFTEYPNDYEIVKVEKTQPDTEHSSEGIVFSYWTSPSGRISGSETLCITAGKIIVHTFVISRSGEGKRIEATENKETEVAETENAQTEEIQQQVGEALPTFDEEVRSEYTQDVNDVIGRHDELGDQEYVMDHAEPYEEETSGVVVIEENNKVDDPPENTKILLSAEDWALSDSQLLSDDTFQEKLEKYSAPCTPESLALTVRDLTQGGHVVKVCETRAEALSILSSMISSETSISMGTSATLQQIGFIEYLKTKGEIINYKALAAQAASLGNIKEQQKHLADGATADLFFSSVVAVTVKGEIFGADLSGTRLSGWLGAKHLVLVLGSNKIVENEEQAQDRLFGYQLKLESARVRVAYGIPGSAVVNQITINKANPMGPRTTIVIIKEPLGF